MLIQCPICSVLFSVRPAAAHRRRYCSVACKAEAMRGQPHPASRPFEAADFWSRVGRRGDDECWPWQGYCEPHGYGRLSISGRIARAHRLAYEFTYGPIAEGQVIRHTCDNPPCCNPAHLLAGSQADNVADRDARGRTARGDRAGARTKPEHHRSLLGEESPTAKLTEAQVRAIRESYRTGGIGARPLARLYQVSRSLIRAIVQGRVWKHVR